MMLQVAGHFVVVVVVVDCLFTLEIGSGVDENGLRSSYYLLSVDDHL